MFQMSDNRSRRIDSLRHQEELMASGLTQVTWESAGIYTETDSKRIASLLSRRRNDHDFGSCIVYPYYDLNGQPTGYHRLKPTNPRLDSKKIKPIKYEAPCLAPPQAYFPVFAHDAILQSKRLLITEGEKKALCACQHGFPTIGLSGVWSWKSKTGGLLRDLHNFPWSGRQIVIVFDSDRMNNRSIQIAEQRLADELTKLGARVSIATLPDGPNGSKTGIDDYFVRGGTEEEFTMLLDKAIPALTNSDRANQLPLNEIIVGVDIHRVANEAIALLANDPETWCRYGMLCRVIHESQTRPLGNILPPTPPRIEPMTIANIQERLSVVARWYKPKGSSDESTTGETELQPIQPPRSIAQAVLERGVWPGVKPLTAIVTFPVILADGSIIDTPGYHSETGLYYHPVEPVTKSVPSHPNRQDALEALETLREVVVDFPFVDECHRSTWFAIILSIIGRYAYSGCTPMFIIDANTPGSGKGLLADCASLIVQGTRMPLTPMPSEGEEFRKKVTSMLIAGQPFGMFDEVKQQLGSAELDALITSTLWSDRLLGTNTQVQFANLSIWLATGNNLHVVGDTSRRICPIRLISVEEHPEERNQFTHPDLAGWVQSNRARLLSATLTVLRAYIHAGKPQQAMKNWGSFEGWSQLVRGALVWLGSDDPYKGNSLIRESSQDEKLGAMRVLMEAFEEFDPQHQGCTSSQIVKAIHSKPDFAPYIECLESLTGEEIQSRQTYKLGYRFREYQDRWIAGRCLKKKKSVHHQGLWIVETRTKTQHNHQQTCAIPIGSSHPCNNEDSVKTDHRLPLSPEWSGIDVLKG